MYRMLSNGNRITQNAKMMAKKQTAQHSRICLAMAKLYTTSMLYTSIIYRAIKIYITFEDGVRMIWFNELEQILPSGFRGNCVVAENKTMTERNK